MSICFGRTIVMLITHLDKERVRTEAKKGQPRLYRASNSDSQTKSCNILLAGQAQALRFSLPGLLGHLLENFIRVQPGVSPTTRPQRNNDR